MATPELWFGPIDPGDKLLLTRDTEGEADWQCAVHAQTLVMQGLAGQYGCYVRKTMVETIKGKGRYPGKKEVVWGVYVGRHNAG